MNWWRRRAKPRMLHHAWQDRLKSRDQDVEFTARIYLTVQTDARAQQNENNLGPQPSEDPAISEAAVWVRSTASEITAKLSVLQRHGAQHELNVGLSGVVPQQLGEHRVTAVTIALAVSPDAHQAALDLEQARREAALDELARKQIAATMRFVRDECFRDPASARLFLMLNASPRLGVFPNADQADLLIEEVIRWHPEALWVQIAKTLDSVVTGLPSTQIEELLRLLHWGAEQTGHKKEAGELERLRELVKANWEQATSTDGRAQHVPN